MQNADSRDETVRHLTYTDVKELITRNAVEWMDESRRIVRFTDKFVSLRGLSVKVGPVLAAAIRRKEPWALVMYANQRQRLGAVEIADELAVEGVRRREAAFADAVSMTQCSA